MWERERERHTQSHTRICICDECGWSFGSLLTSVRAALRPPIQRVASVLSRGKLVKVCWLAWAMPNNASSLFDVGGFAGLRLALASSREVAHQRPWRSPCSETSSFGQFWPPWQRKSRRCWRTSGCWPLQGSNLPSLGARSRRKKIVGRQRSWGGVRVVGRCWKMLRCWKYRPWD